MPNFVHLHVHTDHSFLDGCAKINTLLARVGELEMPAIAMTDHGNMCGAIDFYHAANAAGIKPIIGIEAYFVYDQKMSDKFKCDREKSEDIGGTDDAANLSPANHPKYQINHKTLLAKNYKGFLNLSKLTSESYERGFYRKPRIDMETLAAHSEGVIALSGCLNGVASQYLLYSDYDKARKATGEFLDIFGRENYFIEIQNHFLPEQKKIMPGLVKLAREFGIRLVATNDTHYVRKEDARAHEAMLCVQTMTTLSDPDHWKYPCDEFYIKSRAEMEIAFPDLPEALDSTLDIAEMVDIKIPFGNNHYPRYELPVDVDFKPDEVDFNRILDLYIKKKNEVLAQNGKPADFNLTPDERRGLMKNGLFLFDLAKKGLKKRYGVDYENPEAYVPKKGEAPDRAKMLCDKLDYELSIIVGAGFVDYFLIVYDFINWARSHGIPVGPGRGSGAGCMVAYLIKITDIEPIRFGLLFERMLSLERVSPPDFDVDFCQRRRDEVIDYVRAKYGEDRVANIVTFGKLGAKQVVRDVARILDVSFDRSNEIAKKVPDDLKMTLAKALEISSELREEYERDPVVKEIFKIGSVLEGMIRQTGKHACGIIIGDQRLDNLVPMMIQERALTTQFPKTPVEELGLLKADFLGLKTLTVISDAQDNVRRTREMPGFDIEEVSLDDPATYKLLNSGVTIGVFQLESEGMQNLCRRISLSSVEEIIALIALYRPGPMQFIDQFIEAKKDPSKLQVPHPLLKDLVQETYGVLVYQEQVMMAARIISGYTLGEADILRRAMGKKKPEVMAKQEAIFVRKAKEHNNIGEKEASEIFAVLKKFAEYGFNKSHSAAYAMLSYRTAYLKANHPVEFMAALLSSELGNLDKVAKFIEAAEQINIKVLGPDINISREGFTPIIDKSWKPDMKGFIFSKSAGSIRFGLAAIKGIGEAAAAAIVSERDANGEFKDIFDFLGRVGSKKLNRRVVENLTLSGAFDRFGIDRGHIMASLDAVLNHSQELERDMSSGQTNMFDLFDMGASSNSEDSHGGIIDTSGPIMPLAQKLFSEKELLRFYISGHPMNDYAGFDDAMDEVPDAAAVRSVGRLRFRACGVVSNKTKRITKKDNKQWCFFTLSGRDSSKTWQINFFPSAYEKYAADINDGDCVCVIGECRADQSGEIKMNGESIESMPYAVQRFAESAEWLVDNSDATGRFAKLLSHCVHDDSSRGMEISHKVRIKIGERDYVEMDGASITSRFEPRIFRQMRSDPCVLRFRAKARPIPEPERKFYSNQKSAYRR